MAHLGAAVLLGMDCLIRYRFLVIVIRSITFFPSSLMKFTPSKRIEVNIKCHLKFLLIFLKIIPHKFSKHFSFLYCQSKTWFEKQRIIQITLIFHYLTMKCFHQWLWSGVDKGWDRSMVQVKRDPSQKERIMVGKIDQVTETKEKH